VGQVAGRARRATGQAGLRPVQRMYIRKQDGSHVMLVVAEWDQKLGGDVAVGEARKIR
jgi:hypothetical protein